MMDTEDRISSLPDCLLLDIISRIKIKVYSFYSHRKIEYVRLMSTKEVIKTTSTISKRWQHLWTLLPNLNFNEGSLGSLDSTKYFSFIDKTLAQCPTDVKLNKFKLHIHYDSKFVTILPSQVNSWIRHAITRNVQEVDLKIRDTRITSYEYDNQFMYDDELLFNNSCITSIEISDCFFDPPNGVIRWDKLKCLCISEGELDDDLVGIILSGSPCLETLELDDCYGVRRIDISSRRFKNLVLTNYGVSCPRWNYIGTIEINAPHMLSLTINGMLYLEKLLLLDMSSLVKADLDYEITYLFADGLGRIEDEIGEELLRGILQSLDHVNYITLGHFCYWLELMEMRTESQNCLLPDGKSFFVTDAAETKIYEKVEEIEESDDVITEFSFNTIRFPYSIFRTWD